MKIKLHKLAASAVFVVAVSFLPTLVTTKVLAAPVSYPISIEVYSGCISQIGAATSTFTDVAPGSDVSLVVSNTDNVVSQYINGGGIPHNSIIVGPNTKTSNNTQTVVFNSVTTPITLTFTPIPITNPNPAEYTDYCPTTDTPSSSTFIINPASATLSCLLSGSNWYLNGSFNGSSTGTGIYSQSTLVVSINPGSISQKVTAGAVAQTFIVLDGTDYGGKGTILASTSCPKYVAPVSTPASPPSATTTTPATSTSIPSTTATLTPTTSSAITNPSEGNDTVLTPVMSPSTSNKSLLLKSGFGLLGIILIVALLAVSGIWQKISRLFIKSKNAPQKPTNPEV